MKIFTFISGLLISVASMANQGEIAILSANGDAFYVMVNGTFRNYYPQSNVSVNLSSNQMHNVRIFGSQNNFHLDQNLVAKPERRMTYRIMQQFGTYHLVFVQESPLYGNGSQDQVPQNCCGQCGLSGGHPGGNQCSHVQPGSCGNGQNYGGYQAMTPADFDNLKGAIEREHFSDDKFRVASAAAKSKHMNVNQIKEIAGLFHFSDEKLNFTKVAYANCVDKSNYYLLMEVFSFSSDKRALQEFIDAQ